MTKINKSYMDKYLNSMVDEVKFLNNILNLHFGFSWKSWNSFLLSEKVDNDKNK